MNSQNEDLAIKIDQFNQLCGDWDFRNIDMTEAHLGSIDIDNGYIKIICEFYSTNLDEYISCDSENFKDKNIIKRFKNLDLDNRFEVRDFIEDLESLIDWDKVGEKLNIEYCKILNESTVKILDTWVTDYDDLDYEAILMEDGKEIARIIDGYDEATIRYNIGDSNSELTDEFCKRSLTLLTLENFEELSNRPKLSETSKLLQMLVDGVIANDSSMCFIEYDFWEDCLIDGTFKESDVDILKKEIRKYKLNDMIELDCNDAKFTAYGNLQYIFNDDRNLNDYMKNKPNENEGLEK